MAYGGWPSTHPKGPTQCRSQQSTYSWRSTTESATSPSKSPRCRRRPTRTGACSSQTTAQATGLSRCCSAWPRRTRASACSIERWATSARASAFSGCSARRRRTTSCLPTKTTSGTRPRSRPCSMRSCSRRSSEGPQSPSAPSATPRWSTNTCRPSRRRFWPTSILTLPASTCDTCWSITSHRDAR